MKRLALVAFTAVVLMAFGIAQDKHITIVGEGNIVAMPDKAFVSFELIAREDKPADALESLNKKVKKTLEPLKIAGLESKNIVVSGYKIEPVYFREEKESRAEYLATATMKVTLGNVNRVGDLIEKAMAGGATTYSDPVYSLTQEDNLKAQALDKALADAKAKAAKVAEALGGAVGKPLRFEVTYEIQPLTTNDGKADIYALVAASKGLIMSPFQFNIEAKATVDFELVGN